MQKKKIKHCINQNLFIYLCLKCVFGVYTCMYVFLCIKVNQ